MNSTNLNELKTGDTLQGGKYLIERTIGADGFGITYMAKNTKLNVVYAVKEFFIDGYCVRNDKTVTLSGINAAIYEESRQKFIEEAQALTRLNHPNVVKVVDVFAENNTAYMVTPYMERTSLQKVVEQRGKLSYNTAINYITQLSEALGYIHGKDMLHRDIKPDNIIITSDDKVVLIDFGSVREFVHNKIQHRDSILAQGYAPLEQYTANSRKEAWSDIYSLGAVFYFVLTGQKPMDAATRTLEKMPEPKTLVPSIPDAANRAIMKAMQLKPENRYRTAQEFTKSLLNPENKLQTALGTISNLKNSKGWFQSVQAFTGKLLNTKSKIDRKYLKIIIPAIVAVLIGVFFLMKSSEPVLAMVKLNEKYGYIDRTGKEVIPRIYDDANEFSEGLAEVELNRKGYIDKTGKQVIPCIYEKTSEFSEGLAKVRLDKKWGFIDKKGKQVIPCTYDDADVFSEGLAKVELNDKWGFIDKKGKQVIPCIYDGADVFSEGFARVKLNDKWGYINKAGKLVIPCIYDYTHKFSEEFAVVELDERWGFIDKTGKQVIPCIYGKADDFSEGFAPVCNDDLLNKKWGFIDKTGKEIIPFIYEHASSFSGGLADVRFGNTFNPNLSFIIMGYEGYIDKTGKEVISCIYDLVGEFSEGLAHVELNGKWGYIDRTGKEVIPCIYDNARGFSAGLALIELNDKWGFIDKTGKEIIPCIYDYAASFEKIK
jgi:serine/threonine protein kinase